MNGAVLAQSRPEGPADQPASSGSGKPAMDITSAQSVNWFQRVADRRPLRGQSLILTGNVVGGFDDNLGTRPGSGVSATPGGAASGSSGFADAMLEYSRGGSARQISFRALGSVQLYPGYREDPAITGKARFRGHTRLGSKHTLRYSTQIRFEPLFSTNAAHDVEDVIGVGEGHDIALTPSGESEPQTTMIERRSLVSSNKAYVETDWTRRDSTVASYLYYAQKLVAGDVGNNKYQQAAVEYRRGVTRTLVVHGSYLHTSGEQVDASTIPKPNKQNSLAGGAEWSRLLPQRRRLTLHFGAGATYLEQLNSATREPIKAWLPLGNGSARVDLSRTWSVGAGYGRSFSMLQGLTGEFYATDRVGVSIGGRLISRLEISVGATVATGRTIVAAGANESFRLYSGMVQLFLPFTSHAGATFGYYLNQQRYSDAATLPLGFPASYERNAIFVGVSVWAPVAGSLRGRPRGPGEW
jgi:hypothetical protein